MKSLSERRKGLRYHYFNGVSMILTIDTGKDEDIDRFQVGNYFDGNNTKNARQIGAFILDVFKETKTI